MDNRLILQLSSADAILRREAQEQLVRMGAEAVEPLLHTLADSKDYHQKIAIISVLAKIGDFRIADALIREMETGNLSIRIMSAEALGNFPTPRVFNALMRRLDVESVMVQIWIVESLGRLGDRRAVRLLAKVLNETSSHALKFSIIRVLGELGDSAAVRCISPYIHHEDSFLRANARIALSRLARKDQEDEEA